MREKVAQLKQRAKELRQQPEQTTDRIDAINETAWELRYTSTSLAEELGREAFQLAMRNDYVRGQAFALRNLGVCQIHTDRYQQASESLTKARDVFAESALPDNAALASTTNLLGVAQKYLGDNQKALDNYSVALELCEKTNDREQLTLIYRNVANIYSYLGDYPIALEYYYRALPAVDPPHLSLPQAWLYGCMGDLLWRIGEAKTAIEYSEQAMVVYQKYQDRRSEAVALNNLGVAQQNSGDYSKALEYYSRALQIARERNSFEVQAEANRWIGSLALEKGDRQTALASLTSALQLVRAISSRYDEAETLIHLGAAYEHAGEERASIEIFEEALQISEELGLKEIRAKSHLALSKLFEKQNKPNAALEHFQQYHQFWQEVFGGVAARRIGRLLMQKEFKDERRSRKMQLLHEEGERRRQITRHQSTPQTRSALSQHKLQQVRQFVSNNLDQKITLAMLADVARLNYDYFSRSFKQATDKTPQQFLLEQRIERAKLLLRTTTLPLAEIAFRCGFNSQPHLTTQFRLTTGITPHQFRQNSGLKRSR